MKLIWYLVNWISWSSWVQRQNGSSSAFNTWGLEIEMYFSPSQVCSHGQNWVGVYSCRLGWLASKSRQEAWKEWWDLERYKFRPQGLRRQRCPYRGQNLGSFPENLIFLKSFRQPFLLLPLWLPQWLSHQASTCNAGDTGDMGSIPELTRSPRGGSGNPLQYSCLGNSMDRGAWRARVHGVAKSWTRLSTHT